MELVDTINPGPGPGIMTTSERIARIRIRLDHIKPVIWRSVDGERRAPPEDVGGSTGFEDFLQAMAKPRHPEHRNVMAWYGRRFEADDIDTATITERMAKLARKRTLGKAAFAKSQNKHH